MRATPYVIAKHTKKRHELLLFSGRGKLAIASTLAPTGFT